jgi:hypothetical protein
LGTQVEGLRLPLSLTLLSGVGLGIGLGYLLEPRGGPQRRAWLREKACNYWQSTENLLSSAVQNDGHQRKQRQREEAPTAHQA